MARKQKTYTKQKLIGAALLIVAFLVVSVLYLHGRNFAVMQPEGVVGQKERNLLILAPLLCAIVILPMFAILFFIVWKYREGNTKTKRKYMPEWDNNRVAEFTWWAIPSIIIIILSVVTWNSTHALDPYKALASNKKPITIQVVALDWKWLFIYPGQNIATVNYIQFPVNTPVNFIITADAPMNSFWIPQLGGQIYAMPGMSTQLHLMADKTGDYRGLSANISGKGFSGMTFTAHASSATDYATWLKTTAQSHSHLSMSEYNKLVKPSENNAVAYYSQPDDGLYNDVVMKYMPSMAMPATPAPSTKNNNDSMDTMMNMPGMDMQ